MPQNMKLVFSVTIFDVKSGKVDEFQSAWKEVAEWSKQQFKNAMNGMWLLQDTENPQKFVTTAVWNSIDDIMRWRGRPEAQKMMQRVQELCDHIERHTMNTIAEVTNYPQQASNDKMQEKVKQSK